MGNVQKLLVFFLIDWERLDCGIKNTKPLTLVPKPAIGLHLIKHVQVLYEGNYELLMEETKDSLENGERC